MSSVDLITSPDPLTTERERSRSPVVVVDSSDDEGEGRTTKRRRTSSDDTNASGSEKVIDLTEGDDTNGDSISFRILPKLIKLSPFRFTDSGEVHDGIPLDSLREHLKKVFGIFNNDDDNNNNNNNEETRPYSPVNSDELEITGAKESSNPFSSSSSSSPNTTTTTTTTSSSSSSSSSSTRKNTIYINDTPTKNNKNSNNNTKEKDEKDGKVTLECAICLGEMKNITATTCGHIFCKECIRQAIQVTHCCPLCKKKLTLRSIHPIYI